MLLEAHNLSYRYDNGPWLFQNFNLKINPGERVGLVGPSGRGKTTLGRILAGYLPPIEGKVNLHGWSAPKKQPAYHPVQLVFQHPEKAVNPRWKIEATLNEGGIPDRDCLAALGVEPEWFQRWPHELSGGELQRVCIARAMNPQTQFLIADEMTAMLDAITQAQIWNALIQMAEIRNVGMLVISHDHHLIHHLCSRIYQL